jgi:diguanylate cyclase (GGDEF)-like protein
MGYARATSSETPRQDVQHTAFLIEQICLVLVAQIALINLLSQVFTPLNHLLPTGLLHMHTASACAAVSATLSLFLSESNRSKSARRWGRVFAALTALIAVAGFATGGSLRLGQFSGISQIAARYTHLPASAFAFLLMGLVIFFIRARGIISAPMADGAASCLAFLTLMLVLELGFGLARIPGSSMVGLTSAPTLACLALLTVVIVIRRAEHGVFAVFLGGGIAGQIARILAPFLLFMPFLRELGRARLLDAHLVPTRYATALLTSTMTVVAFGLLLVLTRLINRMQSKIQDLTLRDEMTGLYNYRGFNLFAEQAFRLARRARSPFGVLFIDMDSLKKVNDELGHNAGSALIVETGKLLNETFRETDVIGRLGGDEFVVAGQFDSAEISAVIARLRSGAAARIGAASKGLSTGLSVGFAATEHSVGETLKSVLAQADHAMYKEKREKKRMSLAEG